MSDHTPGPWILATSCSWRRILTRDGAPVITPTNHPVDNHPDLSGREADLELAARAPEMLVEIENLQKLCSAAYQLAGLVGAPVRFLDALSRYQYSEDLLPVSLEECDEVQPESTKNTANWPGCMAPDGAEPCDYHKNYPRDVDGACVFPEKDNG